MNQAFKNAESKLANLSESYGIFRLTPLTIGQGITIGNVLRRTLLSELSGYAITEIKIRGVNSEFSTIPSLREDILELCLNLKQISFHSKLIKKTIGHFSIQGPAIVTARSLQVSDEVHILNPNQYIATVADDTFFEMEVTIESGKGYKLATIESTTHSFDFLPIDAVFSPIKKVNFEINSVSKHLHIMHEELILEIWTDGSLSANDALSQAASNLIKIFQLIIIRNKKFEKVLKANQAKNNKTELPSIPIEELNLSARAYNCLKKQKINSINDLLQYSKKDLSEIKNFGQKSIDEVIIMLKNKLNLTLN